jgi:hypothetical protein
MNLLTLYRLLNDLTDEKRDLEATALLPHDPARLGELEQGARQLAPLIDEIRGEILARELPGARSNVTAQEFEIHLYGAFQSCGSAGPLCGEAMRRSA